MAQSSGEPATGASAVAAPAEPLPSAPAVATPAEPLPSAPASTAPIDSPVTPAAPKASAPYSLPWQLRPTQAVNVIRADSSIAFSDPRSTVASTLLLAYKVTENLSPLVRLGFVTNSPEVGPSASNFENPVLGAIYGIKPHPDMRLGLFLGLALPFGQGGGNTPDPAAAAANQAGVLARSAMDNAMFAVNYFTVFPGLGLAYVKGGFTAQVETTLFRLTRTRGPGTQDSGNTNLTAGLHLGYFIVPFLSLGAELRHQRWLSTPTAVRTNSTLRDNTTIAMGPRVHIKLGEKSFLRPSVAFVMPVDDSMSAAGYKSIFFDVPFNF